MKEKITKFEGYMSGDYECFCLSEIMFNEWNKRDLELRKIFQKDITHEKALNEWYGEYEKLDKLRVYPSYFFPEECMKGKWKFTITIQAKKIEE